MSKVISVTILSLLVFFAAVPQITLGQSFTPCTSAGYTVTVSTLTGGETATPTQDDKFIISILSDKIKSGESYYFRISKVGGIGGYDWDGSNTAKAYGSVTFLTSYSGRDLKLPAGEYNILLFQGTRQKPGTGKCSYPFSIEASSKVPPQNSCEVTATVNQSAITFQGKGNIKDNNRGGYRPYYVHPQTAQIITLTRTEGSGDEITIRADGSFGPKDYQVPPSYPGGDTMVGVFYSSQGYLKCINKNLLTLPRTLPRQCPKGEPFNPAIHLEKENCSQAGGGKCDDNNPGIQTAIGCVHTSPAEFVKDFLTFIIGIGGGLAFLMMLLGVFQMLTSAGNPETLSAGRDRLQSAIIGLLFVIFAVLLLQIIGFDILKIPGFGR